MIEYADYFKRYGIRRIEQLAKPVLWSVNKLFLPFNSVIHYHSEIPGDLGLKPDDPLFRGNKNVLLVKPVVELTSHLGPPIPLLVPLNKFIMPYQKQFKRSRIVKDTEKSVTDRKSLLEMDYAFLPHMFRYNETNQMTPYWKWANIYTTIWDNIEQLANHSNRNQFVVLDLPTVLPPMSMLIKSEEKLTMALYHYFNTAELRVIQDLWTWLGRYRENAIMNKLSSTNYGKVNIIWLHAGRWTVMNLGVLDSWIKKPDVVNNRAIDPFQMQKRFLHMLMSVSEAATVGGVDDDAVEVDHIEDTPSSDKLVQGGVKIPGTDVSKLPDDQKPVLDASEGTKPKGPVKPSLVAAKASEPKSKLKTDHSSDLNETNVDARTGQTIVDDTDSQSLSTVEESELDKNLDKLEQIHELNVASNQPIIDYKPYTPPKEDYESGVMDVANKIAGKGLLSSAEYRRIERLSTRYKEIDNPFGKGKLSDMTVIKPEETKIDEKTPLADEVIGVLDKSMLSSSLKVFDQQYIKNVMNKDVVCMTMNLQKAGIAVQNYEVEHVEDYMDSFYIHTVKVAPVIGSPTTLKFRVPKIEEDDTFRAGGVKLRCRKQRGD